MTDGVKIERQVKIEKDNREQWKEFKLTHVQEEKYTKQMQGGRWVRKRKCNIQEKEDRWNGNKRKRDIEKKMTENDRKDINIQVKEEIYVHIQNKCKIVVNLDEINVNKQEQKERNGIKIKTNLDTEEEKKIKYINSRG